MEILRVHKKRLHAKSDFLHSTESGTVTDRLGEGRGFWPLSLDQNESRVFWSCLLKVPRMDAQVRCMLRLAETELQEGLRRLLVIILEDAILHPSLPMVVRVL